jgi:predicted branched-subunit amino acid permease
MPRNRIITDAIGIGVGVASYGVSFGALGVSSGLDVMQTMTLSLFMFTGASQFALVGVIAAGGSSFAAIITAFFVGIRNFAYAVSMNDLLRVTGLKKILAGHLTIDESTAMALSHKEKGAGPFAFWITGISVFVFWNLATLLGALAINIAGDPQALGLDAAVVAGFLALLWPQLKTWRLRFLAVASALVALFAFGFTPAGTPILIAGIFAAVVTLGMRE